jgi:hypothetical protein
MERGMSGDHFRDATEKVEPVAWFYEERGRRWVTDDLLDAQHSNDGVITPLYTVPQPRKRLDVHEILDLMPEGVPARYDGELIAFFRAIEAAVWGETK